MQLRKGIFERRPGVANRIPADALRSVQMAERNVVKAVECRNIDAVNPAHARQLRIAALWFNFAADDKLVGNQHVSALRISFGGRERRPHRVVIAGDFPLREEAPRVGGAQKRQQPEISRAVLILQSDAAERPAVSPCKENAPLSKNPSGKCEPFGRIVVAADDHAGDSPPAERG